MQKKSKIKILTMVLVGFFAFSCSTSAATVSLSAPKTNFNAGEEFLMEVRLDPSPDSVNAIQGKLVIPTDELSVREIRLGNSSINFWIESPHQDDTHAIVFSGITPGGLPNKNLPVFSVVFESKKSGKGEIKLSDVKILKNDGTGAEVKIVSLPFSYTITDTGIANTKIPPVVDTIPPEDFKPYVGSDQSVFDGKYFLVFTAVDKGSGVDHYEVKEGYFGTSEKASSPYLLTDQNLSKKIYVKAFDVSGNVKEVTVPAKNPPFWLEQYVILSILLVLFLGLFFYKKLWSRRTF